MTEITDAMIEAARRAYLDQHGEYGDAFIRAMLLAALASPAAQPERDGREDAELPGMWESADLSGGEADTSTPAPEPGAVELTWKVAKDFAGLPLDCEHIDYDTTTVYVSVCEKDDGGFMQLKGYAYLEIPPFDSEAALRALRKQERTTTQEQDNG